MKVRFKGDYLEDEKGERIEVSFDELVKGCLENNSFETLSISQIIFEGVAEVTKLEIIRSKDYGKTELYRMLEREIQEDSLYKQAKEKKAKEHIIVRKIKEKEARGACAVYSNSGKMKYLRKRALARMHPYKNYHR